MYPREFSHTKILRESL